MRVLRLIFVALALVGLTAAMPGASASRRRGGPWVPTTDGTSALARTPGSIVFGCCDPPTFAGTKITSRIHWKSWTRESAVGTGAMWVDPCHPDCAAEGFRPHPGTIRLSDPQKLGGHFVFGDISFTYATGEQVIWLKRVTVNYKFLTGSGQRGPDYFFEFHRASDRRATCAACHSALAAALSLA